MSIQGYAVHAAGEPLKPYSYDPGELGPHEVEVAVTHCGICYSDVHLIENHWGMTAYPFIPGHEVVGTVRALGSQVTRLTKGQRVGVGWQNSSCMDCEWCNQGEEQLCDNRTMTCVGHNGGFANAVRVDARFAFPLPEKLDSEIAGPLLCGGATVYSPIRNYGTQAPQRVGVIGIGGLGHLAIQFANAFGCEVTAFSTTPQKEEEARKLGAHHFVNSRDSDALQKAAGSQDLIICTVFANLDWMAWLQALRNRGTLCFVGAVPDPIQFPVFPLMVGEKAIRGSVIGSRKGIAEMLELAARTGVRPMVEVMPMKDVNAALDRLRQNKARYRMVLKN